MAIDLTDKASGNVLSNVGVAESATTPFAASTISCDFDSTADYLHISDGDQTGLDLSTDFTFECWVKLGASGAYQWFINKDDDPATNGRSYTFGLDSANKATCYYFSVGHTNSHATTNTALSGDDLNGTNWVHIAVAVDISAKSFAFYKNGSSWAATVQDTSSSTILNGSASFVVSGTLYGGSHSNGFTGLMDEVRVWSDIRTSTEISNNYNIRLTGTEPNLVAYWPFEALGGGAAATGAHLGLSKVGEGN